MKYNITLPQLEVFCDFKSAKICAHCGSTNTIGHSRESSRIIRDNKVRFIERQRRYCKDCFRTYTIHPQGIEKGYQRSQRLIFCCILMYLAGLSYDKSSAFLSVLFQVPVGSKSTLWQDLQNLGENLKVKKIFTRTRASNQPKIVAQDDGSANHKAVEMLNGLDFPEKGEKAKTKRIPRLNDHQILHQVCLAHTKKNALGRLQKLKNKTPPDILEKLCEIIASNFHPDYLKDLEAMVRDKRVQKTKELHQFLFGELWDKYTKYSLFYQTKGVPTTNNRTERTIGRTKIRYKLCRGLKSISGALNFINATQVFEAKKFDLLLAAF